MRILKNKGEIDINVITTMGVNIKTCDSPIGYFGTGLKYAIAVFLREGIDFNLYVGDNHYYFYTETKTIREKDFDICKMQGKFDSIELGFTTELGKNWELWQAYREIESNCRDENGEVFSDTNISGLEGYTIFTIEEFDEMDSVFLSENKKLLYQTKAIEIYEGDSDYIYYRGIRAKDICNPSRYTYNLLEECTLTEDRLISYDWRIEEIINDAIAHMDDKEIITNVITSPRTSYESSLNMGYNNRVAPKETFIQVFEENKNKCNSSVASYIAEHAPKVPMTQEERAAKFKRELSDFCASYDLEFDIDKDNYITIIANEILQYLNV